MSPHMRNAPARSTDCHVHVFDPGRFPYAAARRYTPPPATVSQLKEMHASLGIDQVVLVQPSVYGTNNDCMLDALKRLGDRARGVAVIDQTFGRDQLDDMFAAGVRGIRMNIEVSKGADATDALRRLSATAEALGGSPLLIQVYAAMPVLLACAPTLRTLHHTVLIDHFGLARTGSDPEKAGFSALLELIASPNIWMKLSGPYQISSASPDYADVTAIAKAMIATSPDRIVWGSDWPHTGGSARPANYRSTDLEPFRTEDDLRNFGLVGKWAPEESLRHRVLVDNPARLFGFRSD
ncbi:Predicted metal-dependent hydrolase, TIM-barrel fold [Variovorax sp. YR752]|nr:Predicted metal-dependent hydrolase, TIM-barrel fold [Variovorax sp. YR752]